MKFVNKIRVLGYNYDKKSEFFSLKIQKKWIIYVQLSWEQNCSQKWHSIKTERNPRLEYIRELRVEKSFELIFK